MIDKKVNEAIDVIKLASQMSEQYYNKPIQVAYSGGKDSDVILDLALKANVDFRAVHNLTTADAPETMRHIKKKFKALKARGIEAEIVHARDNNGKRVTMWNLIPRKKSAPTRITRYCCSIFKESYGRDAIMLTGVRAKESVSRKNRDAFEVIGKTKQDVKRWDLKNAKEAYQDAQVLPEVYDCQLITNAKKNNKVVVNPIINWSHSNVWEYIRTNNVEYNPIYDEGFDRIGCIGCPFGGPRNMQKEFVRWPKYRKAYVRAFEKMIIERKKAGLRCDWLDGEDVMRHWTQDDEIRGQIKLEDLIEKQK